MRKDIVDILVDGGVKLVHESAHHITKVHRTKVNEQGVDEEPLKLPASEDVPMGDDIPTDEEVPPTGGIPEEEKEQEPVSKRYLGKAGDNYLYFVTKQNDGDQVEDMQILNQDEEVVYSAADADEDFSNFDEFLLHAIHNTEMDDVAKDVYDEFIYPKLVEPEMPEDALAMGDEEEGPMDDAGPGPSRSRKPSRLGPIGKKGPLSGPKGGPEGGPEEGPSLGGPKSPTPPMKDEEGPEGGPRSPEKPPVPEPEMDEPPIGEPEPEEKPRRRPRRRPPTSPKSFGPDLRPRESRRRGRRVKEAHRDSFEPDEIELPQALHQAIMSLRNDPELQAVGIGDTATDEGISMSVEYLLQNGLQSMDSLLDNTGGDPYNLLPTEDEADNMEPESWDPMQFASVQKGVKKITQTVYKALEDSWDELQQYDPQTVGVEVYDILHTSDDSEYDDEEDGDWTQENERRKKMNEIFYGKQDEGPTLSDMPKPLVDALKKIKSDPELQTLGVGDTATDEGIFHAIAYIFEEGLDGFNTLLQTESGELMDPYNLLPTEQEAKDAELSDYDPTRYPSVQKGMKKITQMLQAGLEKSWSGLETSGLDGNEILHVLYSWFHFGSEEDDEEEAAPEFESRKRPTKESRVNEERYTYSGPTGDNHYFLDFNDAEEEMMVTDDKGNSLISGTYGTKGETYTIQSPHAVAKLVLDLFQEEDLSDVPSRMPESKLREGISRMETYEEAGMLTNDKGLVIHLDNGQSFTVTVKRYKGDGSVSEKDIVEILPYLNAELEDNWSKLGDDDNEDMEEGKKFDKCVKDGGRVRRVSGEKKHGLDKDEYVNYCYSGGDSFRGEVKKKKTKEACGKIHRDKSKKKVNETWDEGPFRRMWDEQQDPKAILIANLIAEVWNGGFEQWVANTSTGDQTDTRDALEPIQGENVKKLAKMVDEIISMQVPASTPWIEEESWYQDNEERLDAMDREFYDVDEVVVNELDAHYGGDLSGTAKYNFEGIQVEGEDGNYRIRTKEGVTHCSEAAILAWSGADSITEEVLKVFVTEAIN